MKVEEAYKELKNAFPEESEIFSVLYEILGKEELYDGIYIEMLDAGYDEYMNTLLEYIDN